MALKENSFTKGGRNWKSVPDPSGSGNVGIYYEATPTEIERVKNKTYTTPQGNVSGQLYVAEFGGKQYVLHSSYVKQSNNNYIYLPNPPGQEVDNGNANQFIEIEKDKSIKTQVTDTQSPNTSTIDENQPNVPGGSTPINPNTPQEQENNKPKVQRLTYPSTISASQDRIKFTAVEYIASGVTQQANTGSGNLPGTSGIFGANRRKVRSGTSVFLAVQSSITDNNSVDWQGGSLNEIERRLANVALNAMTAKNEDVTKVVTDFAKNVAKDVGTYAPEIRVALAGEAVGIQNILGRFGTVLNPNLELLFTGPQLRPFNFTFKLSPRSKEEATEVKDIINFFKKNMAPVREEPNIFLRAPKTFFIEYELGAGNPHPGLNKIKECALTNCSVDYTPLGTYMTYPDGTMVSYTLSLQFQELEPIYSNDYADELNGTIEY